METSECIVMILFYFITCCLALLTRLVDSCSEIGEKPSRFVGQEGQGNHLKYRRRERKDPVLTNRHEKWFLNNSSTVA